MIALTVDELFEYTEWERGKWRERLHRHGEQVLDLAAGPHGDGRFETVRDLLKHIFAAEKRYVERLTGRPLTDHESIPSGSVDELFQFGAQSRQELQQLVAAFPFQDW